MKRLASLLGLAWLLWSGSATSVAAQSPPGLDGRVLNGTESAAAPAELELVLRALTGRDEGTVVRAKAVDGAFSFPALPATGPAGYRLETTYLGVFYSLELPRVTPPGLVALTVYEVTSDPEVLSALDATLVVTNAEGARLLGFLGVVRLRNSSDRTFVSTPGESAPMDLLRFSLPPNASGLDVQTFLRGGHLVQVDRGFALTTPVPPGSHDLLFTFRAPYEGRAWSFDRGFPLGAVVFRVMVAEGLGAARAEGLTTLSPVTVDSQSYQLLEARDVARGSRTTITLEGLPQPPWWQAAFALFGRPGVRQALVPAVLGIALLGLLGLAVARRGRGPRAPSDPERGLATRER